MIKRIDAMDQITAFLEARNIVFETAPFPNGEGIMAVSFEPYGHNRVDVACFDDEHLSINPFSPEGFDTKDLDRAINFIEIQIENSFFAKIDDLIAKHQRKCL